MPLWTLKPSGDLVWPLHAGQIECLEAEERFILLLAGFQSGKTSFLPCWLDCEISKCGPGDYLAASATFDLMQLKMLPEFIAYFRGCHGFTYKARDALLESPNGDTRIIFRSGSKPDAIESATALAAVTDEWGQDQVPLESWEALQRRMSLHQGRVLSATTPYHLGWLYQQVFKRAKAGDKNYRVISFSSLQNPAFPRSEWNRLKETLPAWKFDMFCRGRFTRPAGLIYGDYEDSYATFTDSGTDVPGSFKSGGNLCRPFKIPDHWNRDVGVDFGDTVHNAQVWIAEDPVTMQRYAYREVIGVRLTGPEQAEQAAAYNERVRFAAGGAKSEEDDRTAWAIAGFPLSLPLIQSVEAGIDCSISQFKRHKLFIFDTLGKLRSDLATYSRTLDALGEPTQAIADKDKYHLLDALRYVTGYYQSVMNKTDESEGKQKPRSPRSVDESDDYMLESQLDKVYSADDTTL